MPTNSKPVAVEFLLIGQPKTTDGLATDKVVSVGMVFDEMTSRRRRRSVAVARILLLVVATSFGLVAQRKNAHHSVEAFGLVVLSRTSSTTPKCQHALAPRPSLSVVSGSTVQWHGQRSSSSFYDWRCFFSQNTDGDLGGGGAGMTEAFRQLDELSDFSLDDDKDKDISSAMGKDAAAATAAAAASSTTPKKTLIETPANAPPPPSPVTLEQEAKLYQNMARDLEDTSEEDLYSDVMSDILEGDPSSATQLPQRRGPPSPPSVATQPTPLSTTSDNDALFNQALQEALLDVKLNNPSIRDSVLDDKELMQEIEQIFERGNDELMANLEALRQEQRDLARVSAEETATEAVNGLQAEARRLAQAEASMQTMLNRVGQESHQVEMAAQGLRDAQKQLDQDFLYQVKTGGIVKQLSLVGMVLFSIRSIADTVSTLTSTSSSSGGLDTALLQGGIALLCALVFFVVK